MSVSILKGDCRDVLRSLPGESVHCVVTSPPYFGLRDYSVAGQIGLEPTYTEYVETMVAVFREVKRVLRSDGVCFLNLGDSFCSANQSMLYSLREDRSLEELQHVALAMFGLRITGDETTSEGALSEMLPVGVQGKAIRQESALASRRIQEELSEAPSGNDSAHLGAEQADENRCDHGAGREVRLLRRNDSTILDAGSHQRGWRGSSQEIDWQEPVVIDQDLSRGETPRLSEGSLSSSLLQLQLRLRIMGLLSARKFTGDEVSASVRSCFKASPNLKPKDLCGIPWRVAFALQADGWYLRQDIIWSKPNPMPESVTDRCTKAHEYIFLLSKSARYFWDAEAIKEENAERYRELTVWKRHGRAKTAPDRGNWDSINDDGANAARFNGLGRNKRSVWEVATHPYPEAHFATFPPALIEPCIKAGTSEKGCCAKCGAPWVRQISNRNLSSEDSELDRYGDGSAGVHRKLGQAYQKQMDANPIKTLGWLPSCSCNANTVPCTVIDPFGGAGTTGLVADRLGRNCIGIELNPEYAAMSERRIRNDAGMFAQVAAE